MARFRTNDQQNIRTLIYQHDGLRIERVQRFDQTALLAEMSNWSCWRMRLTLGGTRYLTYESRRYTLSPNTVCWSGPVSEPVRTSWLPGTGSDVIDISWSATRWRRFVEQQSTFAENNAALLAKGRQPLFALLPAPPQMLHVLRQMISLAHKADASPNALENQATLLTDILSSLKFAKPPRKIDESQRKRVDRAQAAMVAHLSSPLNIADIAAQLNVSARQLQRDFNLCTGLTPIRYFNLMRLSEANFLLAETSMPVAKIAESLGYVSVTHFSTAFRQVYHCSPREVRRQSTAW